MNYVRYLTLQYLIVCTTWTYVSGLLKCKICSVNQSEIHTDLTDVNQRITFNLNKPYCRLYDVVVCDRNQKTCISEVTQITTSTGTRIVRTYIMLNGCSYKSKHPSPGCTSKKGVAQRLVFEEGRQDRKSALNQISEICVCDYDYCNRASIERNRLYSFSLLALILVRLIN